MRQNLAHCERLVLLKGMIVIRATGVEGEVVTVNAANRLFLSEQGPPHGNNRSQTSYSYDELQSPLREYSL